MCQREATKAWRKTNKRRYPKADRRSWLKTKFRITPQQYDEMLAAQNGVCGICQLPERVHTYLAVDHCHVTGNIRGLLCFFCNTAIGKLNDDPALVRRAAEYLEKGGASGPTCLGH